MTKTKRAEADRQRVLRAATRIEEWACHLGKALATNDTEYAARARAKLAEAWRELGAPLSPSNA